jgi:ubiquinone/menaquinone biosynthesis C-methylase UbiE
MQAQDKPYRGMSMEGVIARSYARATRIDLPELDRLADRIAISVTAGSRILEVAPGPGNLAIALDKRGLRVNGIDISKTFVQIAIDEARRAASSATFQQGDVHALPFAESTFDFLVCRAAFKNFSRPLDALREMRRVLRPDVQGLIIDMRRDVTDEETDRFAATRSSNRIGVWWNGWGLQVDAAQAGLFDRRVPSHDTGGRLYRMRSHA